MIKREATENWLSTILFKWFLGLLLVVGVLYCSFGELSKETKTLIGVVVGAMAAMWVLQYAIGTERMMTDHKIDIINKRLENIENFLRFYRADNIEERVSRPISYKANITLTPHWKAILDEFARQLKCGPEVLQKIIESGGSDTAQRKHLWGRDFSFHIFRNEASGMRQVWSEYHKTFVDKIEVKGIVFDPRDLPSVPPELDGTSTSGISTSIKCTPRRLSLSGGLVPESVILSHIPYRLILSLLVKLAKADPLGAEYSIKRFPDELQKEMDENNVLYDHSPLEHYWKPEERTEKDIDWNDGPLNEEEWFKKEGIQLYDELVDCHAFHTPYYTVSISLSSFSPSRGAYLFS